MAGPSPPTSAGDVTPAGLVRGMVGHDLPERKSEVARPVGEVALRVRNLRAGERVRDVSFEVRRGEILGIAGLVGAGRTETLRAIFGADAKDGGEIFVGGQPVVIRQPGRRFARRHWPRARRSQTGWPAVAPIHPGQYHAEHHCPACQRRWLAGPDAEKPKPPNLSAAGCRCNARRTSKPVGELSGGNQQKVVIARWLARDCRILLFDEPTRGIDVAAKHTIYQLLRDLAAEGKAVVVVSSELVELMSLCDRILVMSQGQHHRRIHARRVDAGKNHPGRVQRLSRPREGTPITS